MIKNHTHNDDSGSNSSIHNMFKRIINLDIFNNLHILKEFYSRILQLFTWLIFRHFCRIVIDASWVLYRLMPSAHGAIFCRKELWEKVGVKVRFFLGLSQRTRPIFCRKQLREKIGAILYRSKSQRTRTDFLLDL